VAVASGVGVRVGGAVRGIEVEETAVSVVSVWLLQATSKTTIRLMMKMGLRMDLTDTTGSWGYRHGITAVYQGRRNRKPLGVATATQPVSCLKST
jgi:hypothetical protein